MGRSWLICLFLSATKFLSASASASASCMHAIGGIPLGDLKLRSLVILRKLDAKIFVLASKFELEENFVEFAADENQDPTIFCDHRCQGPWSSCEGAFTTPCIDTMLSYGCKLQPEHKYDNPLLLTDVSINIKLEEDEGKIHRVDPKFAS